MKFGADNLFQLQEDQHAADAMGSASCSYALLTIRMVGLLSEASSKYVLFPLQMVSAQETFDEGEADIESLQAIGGVGVEERPEVKEHLEQPFSQSSQPETVCLLKCLLILVKSDPFN
jgi:hypothetical protein